MLDNLPTDSEVGAVLKKARKDLRLSQDDCAGFVGVTRQAVGPWEKGETPFNHVRYLAALARQDAETRKRILELLRIAPADAETNPALQILFQTVRAAHGHPSRLVRATLASLTALLEIALQENPADKDTA